ncbi:hypothetical protein LB941_05455 [Ligilactobacillus sp. WILCCON 0076]|uniref:Integrase n=1 Tax=Ligilactobacillus ubinensis TaxID=2876789 RepID=A0A9X2JLA4_9LACO|nr:hypothetical protein [Ligilactobacillus ubinensis]MCP0886783.1 hypothetical protein [Ligilactobacillus ubinensis]
MSEGADIYFISKRLGHSDLATTTRTYAYLLDEFKVKQDNAFEKYLNNLTIQETEKEKQSIINK